MKAFRKIISWSSEYFSFLFITILLTSTSTRSLFCSSFLTEGPARFKFFRISENLDLTLFLKKDFSPIFFFKDLNYGYILMSLVSVQMSMTFSKDFGIKLNVVSVVIPLTHINGESIHTNPSKLQSSVISIC